MACITGLLGGKPAMISGAAGALAVVVTDLTADDGPLENLTSSQRLNVLYMTMFVCGIAQIVFAWFRLGTSFALAPTTISETSMVFSHLLLEPLLMQQPIWSNSFLKRD